MKGYIREVKGRAGYYELVVEGDRDPVNGKRRQVRKGYRAAGRTKRERDADAERAKRNLVTEVEEGRHRGTDATLAYLLSEWLDTVEGDLAATTVREYRRLVKKRIKPELGDVSLSKLEADRLDAFYRRLRKEGLSTASIRQIHAIIRRALNQAVDWRWLDANPAQRAGKSLTVRAPELTPPTPAEALRLMDAAAENNPELAAFLRLKAGTGARRGEVCGLKRSDYDHKGQSLLIARSVAVVGRQNTIVKDTKTHQARRIGLGADTAKVIGQQIARVAVRAALGGVKLVPDPFLFTSTLDGSRPWNPDHATKQYVTLRNKLGLRGRLHDFRHMHATELGGKGVPVRTIAGRLGHAQASTTLNMYSHHLKASDQDAAATIDEILSPDAKKPPHPQPEAEPEEDAAAGEAS